jgi:hypothetical protein
MIRGVPNGKTSVTDLAELVGGYVAQPAPANTIRGIVASAKKINLSDPEEAAEAADTPWRAWQNEAWEHSDSVGEINYGHEILGSVMSRLRLYAAINIDPDAPPASVNQLRRRKIDQTPDEEAYDEKAGLDIPEGISDAVLDYAEQVMVELGSGYGGISELLRVFTINTAVPGECYLAFIDNRWSIRSTSEITVRQGDGVVVLREARTSRAAHGLPWRELPKTTPLIRIWKRHARFSREPTSSMLALLEMCSELRTLQQMIRGIARSRMNAGILFLPDGLSVAGNSVTEDKDQTEDETESLVEELFDAMTTPVTDETAGTSVVPLVISGPGELGKQIIHKLFARESDQFLIKRADTVLERILNGLNIPKEKISGMDSVRYTNANVIDEDLYKIHIEPSAVMLCDALSSAYLRARIKSKFRDLPSEILAKLCVWYDPTEIVIKTDAAESANEGYDKYLISGDAWRRAHGYSDTDAPSQTEIAFRMVIDQVGKNLQPVEQADILHQVLPEIFGKTTPAGAPLRPNAAPQDATFGPGDAITTAEAESDGLGDVDTVEVTS